MGKKIYDCISVSESFTHTQVLAGMRVAQPNDKLLL